MNKSEQLSPLALAFLGDSIHTAYVRKKVLEGQLNKINNYHNQAKKFCNAKNQKDALEKVLPLLSDDENDIVRRARNSHSKHSAKNFDEETYKKATAFEALVGFLYLNERKEKLFTILDISMQEKEVKNEN